MRPQPKEYRRPFWAKIWPTVSPETILYQFAPLFALPEQTPDYTSQNLSERRLLVEITTCGVEDLFSRNEEAGEDAVHWFWDYSRSEVLERTHAGFSFERACEYLKMDCDGARLALLEQLNKKGLKRRAALAMKLSEHRLAA